MTERRYDDQETAAIFHAASEGQPAPSREPPGSEGLTLRELEAIGREVGLEPTAIARAAASLDVARSTPARRWFGLPLRVSHTVDLPRPMSDAEWERFVVRLREVFDATGGTRTEGSLRQWSNGNLHVLLEPTATGQRLRFSTLHGAARSSIALGGAMLVGAAVLAIAGDAGNAALGMMVMAGTGVAMILSGALRVPGWARLRRQQMEMLATQAAAAPAPGLEPPPR